MTKSKKTNAETNKEKRSLADKYPRLNILLGYLMLLFLFALGGLSIYFIVLIVRKFIIFLSGITAKMDAVVIVALITGAVSLVGVIISSVVSKYIDYKKSRQDYLAKKREKPYGEFIDMVYKLQQNSGKKKTYTEKEMISDLTRFSKEITLWGSSKVVKKWVKFRESSLNQDQEFSTDILFVAEDIMNEMRKDLGLKRTNKGNLLSFFINDIKDYINN